MSSNGGSLRLAKTLRAFKAGIRSSGAAKLLLKPATKPATKPTSAKKKAKV